MLDVFHPKRDSNRSLHACVLSHFHCVWLCVTLWTITLQAPLSMGFSRQEYWNGVSCPPPGDLLDPGIKLAFLKSPALAGWFFTTSVHLRSLYQTWYMSGYMSVPLSDSLWNSWFFKTWIPHIFFSQTIWFFYTKRNSTKSFFFSFFLPSGPLLLWYSISFRSWKPSRMIEWRSDMMPTLEQLTA